MLKIEEIVSNLKTNEDINEMISICKRVKNTKRDFLFVNSYQGKHIPMSPTQILNTYEKLNRVLVETLTDKKRIFIAFAETATAIGSYLAERNNGYFLTTTREILYDDNGKEITPLLVFEEEHSHAVSQLLYCKDEKIFSEVEEIIFIDDEISTGKTIFNFIHVLEEKLSVKNISFKVVSFLNWMTEDDKEKFKDYEIDFVSLAYGSLKDTKVKVDVTNVAKPTKTKVVESAIELIDVDSNISLFNEIRLGTEHNTQKKVVNEISDKIVNSIYLEENEKKNILVLGTEEFMYIPLLIAKEIEDKLNVSVKYHATTRSPITISEDNDYKVKSGFEFKSLNDSSRTNFIYNLEKYDEILLITDNNNWLESDYHNSATIIDTISNFTDKFIKLVVIK